MCQTGAGEMCVLGSAVALSEAQRAEAAVLSAILQCGPMAKSVPKSRGHNAAVPGAEFSPQM